MAAATKTPTMAAGTFPALATAPLDVVGCGGEVDAPVEPDGGGAADEDGGALGSELLDSAELDEGAVSVDEGGRVLVKLDGLKEVVVLPPLVIGTGTEVETTVVPDEPTGAVEGNGALPGGGTVDSVGAGGGTEGGAVPAGAQELGVTFCMMMINLPKRLEQASGVSAVKVMDGAENGVRNGKERRKQMAEASGGF
ncbi:MAG: hypothetical protein Q9160_001178 [Pyrenula sp. 1 TL-2023]